MQFIRCALFLFILPAPLFAKPHWAPLKETVIKADLATNRSKQKDLAKSAMQMAEVCLYSHPEEAACYYYRGQAKGLYYKNVVFGYVGRVRSMLADWEKAMALDPSFDFGGPYRMFAEVYTALPTFIGPKNLRRDLKKAVQYLEKAIKISDYPTNYLDLAEARLKEKEREKGREALEKARTSLPRWKNHPYSASWMETLNDLEKKLK